MNALKEGHAEHASPAAEAAAPAAEAAAPAAPKDEDVLSPAIQALLAEAAAAEAGGDTKKAMKRFKAGIKEMVKHLTTNPKDKQVQGLVNKYALKLQEMKAAAK